MNSHYSDRYLFWLFFSFSEQHMLDGIKLPFWSFPVQSENGKLFRFPVQVRINQILLLEFDSINMEIEHFWTCCIGKFIFCAAQWSHQEKKSVRRTITLGGQQNLFVLLNVVSLSANVYHFQLWMNFYAYNIIIYLYFLIVG